MTTFKDIPKDIVFYHILSLHYNSMKHYYYSLLCRRNIFEEPNVKNYYNNNYNDISCIELKAKPIYVLVYSKKN